MSHMVIATFGLFKVGGHFLDFRKSTLLLF